MSRKVGLIFIEDTGKSTNQNSLEHYRNLCDLTKKCHKSEIKKICEECKKHISGLELICLCNYIKPTQNVSNELLFFIMEKCKKICNFCQYKKQSRLYDAIKQLPYFQIVQLFSFEYLCKTSEIIDNIILSKINEIPMKDMMHIIEHNKKIKIPASIVQKLINSINSNYSNTNDSFLLLNKLIDQDQFIDDHSKILTRFIMQLMKKNKLSLFDKTKLLPFFQSDYLLEYALATQNYDCVKEIISNCNIVHISDKHYDTILWLYSNDFSGLCTKLTNITELISFNYKRYIANGSFDLIVNPSKILLTVGKLHTKSNVNEVDKLSDNQRYYTFIENMSSKKRPYVIYQTESGDVGVDMGGVSRDFYTQSFIEVKDYFVEVDGYYSIPLESEITPKNWKMIGLIAGRSSLCENISPSINIHPILCYLLLEGGGHISFDNLISALDYFSLEIIDNLLKLLKMPENDYKDFMELQGEDPDLEPKKYIMNILINKFINKNVIAFVNGFRNVSKNVLFVKYINFISFYKFMCGVESYNITKINAHSLKNNFEVHEDIYSDKELKIANQFKEAFLEVLEELNVNNIAKLKFFLKYWLGTSSINSFNDKFCKVELTNYNDTFGCFKSSTCFNKLYVYRFAVLPFANNKKELRKKIIEIMDKSLTNQQIVESIGLHMQTA
jgi:hypothetical protein